MLRFRLTRWMIAPLAIAGFSMAIWSGSSVLIGADKKPVSERSGTAKATARTGDSALAANAPTAKPADTSNQRQRSAPGPGVVGGARPEIVDRVEAALLARRLDELIDAELKSAGVQAAPPCSDEDFLRRVSIDIAGRAPTASEVTLFGLDPDPEKRARLVDRLLTTRDYAQNWARYWRDVISLRATEPRSRLGQRAFEEWLTEQFATGKNWSEISTALLTATGDVRENGATHLFFAHAAEPEEIASEVSRIFLGVQIQCANCHDHPTDQWKREQFHTLAAFFPRVQMRIKRADGPLEFEIASLTVPNGLAGRMQGGRPPFEELRENPERLIRLLDRDGDRQISREEAQKGPGAGQFVGRILEIGDANKDGKLSLEEIKSIPAPMMQTGRGSPEHFMPDLQNPSSKGTEMEPSLFLMADEKFATGLDDLERRRAIARLVTSPDNPWFAKSFVNRLWFELNGEAFVMPIDDMGPGREERYPKVLDTLAAGFVASNYDIRWLFRTVVSTRAYQRQVVSRDPKSPLPLMAAAVPSRLRADELFESLVRVLGLEDALSQYATRPAQGAGQRFGDFTPRGQFHTLFVTDPSAMPDEITGTVPQALFFMNSDIVNNAGRAQGRTRLAELIAKHKDEEDLLREMYLMVLSREPTGRELTVCRKFLKETPSRNEALEDIHWSLLNSTEFLSKR
jgi:hypothetical protein